MAQQLASIEEAADNSKSMWATVTLTMSAAIVTLRKLGWQPSSPTVWNSDDGEWRADAGGCTITRQIVLQEMNDKAAAIMWANAMPHEVNGGRGGLHQGRPNYTKQACTRNC